MKVKIEGAGLSGLAAGAVLATEGHEVVFYDKKEEFDCPEHISAVRNYSNFSIMNELEKRGLEEIEHNGLIRNTFRHSPNYCSKATGEQPIFYLFNRGSDRDTLEGQLYRRAKNEGAKFRFNSNCSDPDIVATGSSRPDIVGFGYNYRDLNMDRDELHVFYNNDYASKGYVYVTKTDKCGTIAAVSFEDNFNELRENFEKFLKKDSVQGLVDRRERIESIAGYATYDVPRTAEKDGSLYTGEAAGFQDPSKGFGIYYALMSGFLAAKAINEDKDYDNLWKNEFGEKLKKQYIRRIKLNRATNNHYDNKVESIGTEVNINEYRERTRKTSRLLKTVYPMHLAYRRLKHLNFIQQ